MVDADVISAKLGELADRVARVRTHRKASAKLLAADRDALDLVSFNLMLAVQACADIASHLIADEGWPPAGTVAQSFVRLEENGVIEAATAHALGRAVGLRNVVAHGYASADPSMVHAASTAGLDDLAAFARQVAGWIASR